MDIRTDTQDNKVGTPGSKSEEEQMKNHYNHVNDNFAGTSSICRRRQSPATEITTDIVMTA